MNAYVQYDSRDLYKLCVTASNKIDENLTKAKEQFYRNAAPAVKRLTKRNWFRRLFDMKAPMTEEQAYFRIEIGLYDYKFSKPYYIERQMIKNYQNEYKQIQEIMKLCAPGNPIFLDPASYALICKYNTTN